MGNDERYQEAAEQLGEVLAQYDCSLYYGGAVRMKIYIQLYGGHIQCVRTNFIIAVTCRLVDLVTW